MTKNFKVFTTRDLGSYNRDFFRIIPTIKDEGFRPGTISDAVNLILKGNNLGSVETISSVAFNRLGDLKILPQSDFVEKLNNKDNFRYVNSFHDVYFRLSDDDFNSLDGFYFSGDEYNKIINSRFKKFKFVDESLFNVFVNKNSYAKNIVKDDPLWLALINDNRDLLSDYVDFVFEKDGGKSYFMHPFKNNNFLYHRENLKDSSWIIHPNISNIRLGEVKKGSHLYLVDQSSLLFRTMLGVK